MVSFRLIAAATALAVFAAACTQGTPGGGAAGGGNAGTRGTPGAATPPAMTAAPNDAGSPSPGSAVTTDSKAANLRTNLNYLLGEHIILASKATGAALGGRQAEYGAYGTLLNRNGTELGEMIGAAYGKDARDQFNRIWSAHNGFFVDYTVGVASKDRAKQSKAVQDLTTVYVPQFSTLIATATGLPKNAVTKLTEEHVVQTKRIVDDQAKKDWRAVYADVRLAYAHMQMIGDAIAPAIAKQNAEAFPGTASSKAVDLRVGLNQLLQEHLYLASSATGAALGGRKDEFAAAGKALNDNGVQLGTAIGSVYGEDAQNQFNKIWSAHNGFFVDYTVGVAGKDKGMQDKAVQDLTQIYVPQFARLLSGATGLPQSAVATLTTEHVVTTRAIVDAQGSGDAGASARADREAARHMRMIGDPLAAAIVAQMPDQFR